MATDPAIAPDHRELLDRGLDLAADERFAEALDVFRAARARCPADEPDTAAECLRWIGAVLLELSDPGGAAAALSAGIGSIDPERNVELYLDCTADLGLALVALDRPEDAVELWRIAADGYGTLGLDEPRADCLTDLAGLLDELGDPVAAATALRDAGAIYRTIDRPADAARCRYLAADAALQLGDPVAAAEGFGLARTEFDALGLIDAVAECDERLGGLLAEAGRSAEAITVLRRAADGYLAADAPADVVRCGEAVIAAAMATQDVEVALDELGRLARLAQRWELPHSALLEEFAQLVDLARGGGAPAQLLAGMARLRPQVAEVAPAESMPTYDEQLGLQQAAAGQHADATTTLRRAADGFAATDDPIGAARCGRAAVQSSLAVDDLAGAGAVAASVVAWSAAAADEPTTGAWAECATTVGWRLADSGRHRASIAWFEWADSAHTSVRQTADAAECRRRIGYAHWHLGGADAALAAWADARERFLVAGRTGTAARCELARAAMYQVAGHTASARAGFTTARTLFEQAGEPVEVTRCDVQLALISPTGQVGAEAEPVLLRARAVFDEAGEVIGRVHVRRELALLYRQLGRHTEAERTQADARAIAGDDDAALADLLLIDAQQALDRAEFESAIDLAERARDCCRRIGLDDQAQISGLMIGTAECMLGRYETAEVTLLDARSGLERYDLDRDHAQAEMQLGVVYAETGRLDEAEQAFDRAGMTFDRLGLAAPRAMLRHYRATLAYRRGRFAEAEAGMRAASQAMTAAGLGRRAAGMDLRAGIALAAQEKWPEAEAVFRAAKRAFAADPDAQWQAGLCDIQLALIAGVRGRYEQALTLLGSARRVAADLGMTAWVAKCDLLAAGPTHAMAGRAGLPAALELALPALVFLDAQRFRFSRASSRVAWNRQLANGMALMFELAADADDAALIAELVETTINSGTHIAQSDESAALVAAEIDANVRDETVIAPPQRPAATALLAGPRLLMSPPPRLRIPGGGLVLSPHVETADRRYEKLDRPGEVPLW